MAAVAQLCAKVVEVNPVTTDRYRRTVAVVTPIFARRETVIGVSGFFSPDREEPRPH